MPPKAASGQQGGGCAEMKHARSKKRWRQIKREGRRRERERGEGGIEVERMCEEETASEGTRCREIMMETQHESQRKKQAKRRRERKVWSVF